MDCLAIMWHCNPRGALVLNGKPMDGKTIANVSGGLANDVDKLMANLIAAGVAEQLPDGTIINRRMYRKWALRNARSEAGRKGAAKRWWKNYSKPMANENGKSMAKYSPSYNITSPLPSHPHPGDVSAPADPSHDLFPKKRPLNATLEGHKPKELVELYRRLSIELRGAEYEYKIVAWPKELKIAKSLLDAYPWDDLKGMVRVQLLGEGLDDFLASKPKDISMLSSLHRHFYEAMTAQREAARKKRARMKREATNVEGARRDKEEEKRARAEFEALPTEEKIRKRLEIWMNMRKAQGRPPTRDDIDHKTAELRAEFEDQPASAKGRNSGLLRDLIGGVGNMPAPKPKVSEDERRRELQRQADMLAKGSR